MPHRRSLLRARLAAAALLPSIAACSPTGTLVVVADGSVSGESLEVLALPVDPALMTAGAYVRHAPAPSGSPRADSIARVRMLDDSARATDERFQRVRAALNEEAHDIMQLDRRSADYAGRYDAHRVHLVEAERQRLARDRLRDRATAMRARLGNALRPGETAGNESARIASRADMDAARDGHRRARAIDAGGSAVAMELERGAWWVGVARHGDSPASFTRVTIRGGSRDSIRLSPE
ncbi:MAG TPA: hypothetical protein VMM18_07790 [Gemmatimonadaceae bacterium]|nr:hypothetical protein [Gemmatimonadaceae bacterium]